jgi:hypothetical protein
METAQIIVAFIFGVTFIVTMLVLAIFFPRPEPFQYTVFRVTLALAAAGVAAMIPGFITLNFNPSAAVLIHAGGALAVFVIVYFLSPAGLVAESPRSQVLAAGAEGLNSLHDLDNAIRQTVGPLTRFDCKWLDKQKDEAIKQMGLLADTEEILPRVRQSISKLRQLRDSIKVTPEEREFAESVLACGETVLQGLGQSQVTPWPGPQELALLVNLVRTADTPEAEKQVRQEAEKVYALVNRNLLRDADHTLGVLSGKR